MEVAPPPPRVPAAVEPAVPEPVPRRRTARREEFDRFVAAEYSGLLAEVTILLDDPTRAVRRLRRALAVTWHDWDRVREDPEPADRVRDRLLTRLDHRAHAPRGRSTSSGRPVTLTALAELPGVQRQALVLHHVLGRTVEQVAADTASSVTAVRQRLCHGAWALANRHPHVRAVPLPRAAPRPHPEARTRVMTDVLDGWASTELEVLRETMRLELASEQHASAGARVRHHDQRRLAMTAAAAAVGAAGAVVLVGMSVHALAAPTPPSASVPGPETAPPGSAPGPDQDGGGSTRGAIGPGAATRPGDPGPSGAAPSSAGLAPTVPSPAVSAPAVPGVVVPGPAAPGPGVPGLAGPGLAGPGLAGPGLAGPGAAGSGVGAAAPPRTASSPRTAAPPPGAAASTAPPPPAPVTPHPPAPAPRP